MGVRRYSQRCASTSFGNGEGSFTSRCQLRDGASGGVMGKAVDGRFATSDATQNRVSLTLNGGMFVPPRETRAAELWCQSSHIFYAGNGTVPVDSGLPDVGGFFVVGDNGDLLFFHYTGHGQQHPTGTLGFDPPHPGDGPRERLPHLPSRLRLTTRRQDGSRASAGHDDLRRGGERRPALLPYTGNGEPDPTGTLGFEGPNQGNQIGNGFTGLDDVVGAGGGVFLAVPTTGELRYFHYTGHGNTIRQGPSASPGTTRETRSARASPTSATSSAASPTVAASVASSTRWIKPVISATSVTTQRRAGSDRDAALRSPQPREPDRPRLLAKTSECPLLGPMGQGGYSLAAARPAPRATPRRAVTGIAGCR